MIAEINNKLITGEDELTGNFFGSMRYLGFNDFLIPILRKISHNEKDIVNTILKEEVFIEESFEFWKRVPYSYGKYSGEIDGYFCNDNVIVGVEVKYKSGLSGEDQLIREAGMLNIWDNEKRKKKILFFIAENSNDCIDVYNKNFEKCKNENVILAWCTWKEIYEKLKEICIKDEKCKLTYKKIILEDLLDFLKYKGFESFVDFRIDDKDAIIDEKDYFKFNYKLAAKEFSFIIKNDIKKEVFYEF